MANIDSSTRSSHSGRRGASSATALSVIALAVTALLANSNAAQSRTRKVAPVVETNSLTQTMLQPLQHRRLLLVLPTRMAQSGKETPTFTSAFLRQSDVYIRRVLTASGRYSLMEVRRFNPVLMRAVQDGVATSDDLNNLLNQPTTPNASIFLSKLTFDKPPLQAFVDPALIASFVVDSATTTDSSASVKLTGRLYSADGQTVLRSLSSTTTVPYASAGDMTAAATVALKTSIDRVIGEFTRIPSEKELVTGVTPTVSSTPVVETPVVTPGGIVLPGKPIRGSSSHGVVPLSPAASLPSGTSTVVETPGAEVFPAASAATDSSTTDPTATSETPSTDTTAATTTDTSGSEPVVDTTAATTPDTATTSSTETPATTDGSGADVAGAGMDTASDTSASSSAGSGTNPTPTDNSAVTGTTSDGTDSSGTVGASSTESHPRFRPLPSEDSDLAFEY